MGHQAAAHLSQLQLQRVGCACTHQQLANENTQGTRGLINQAMNSNDIHNQNSMAVMPHGQWL